ncbi:unnamed protein product [Camellia sinensis]
MERKSRIFSNERKPKEVILQSIIGMARYRALALKISNSLGLIAGFFKSGGCLQPSLNIEGVVPSVGRVKV